MKLFLLLATCALAATAYPGTPQRPRPWWNSLESTEGRIVGGFEVDIKDVPYQVSLRSFGSHICGGSIISKRWILTAAHCASSADKPKETIRVGSSEKGSGGQILKLKRIVQHPQYDGSIIDYDFSLLELAEELELDDSRTTIALPEQDEPVTDGAICRVSGWGNTQSSSQSNKFLRATDVPSVNQDKCSEAYSDFGGVTPRMICAGYQEGGKDACQGDSGGPLVSGGKLVGVVSWGYGCAVAGYPGVYSRVASVRDWIKEVDNSPCVLEILDTAGTEQFASMRDLYIKNGHGFIVMYSLTNHQTFQDISSMRNVISRVKGSQPAPILLVANKLDLDCQREVSTAEGSALAELWDCPFIEASAKDRINVNEVFATVVREMNMTSEKRQKKSYCCCTLL